MEIHEIPSRPERIIAGIAEGAWLVAGVGFLVVPLVLWVILQRKMPFAAQHAKQAFLFQLFVFCVFFAICMIAAILGEAMGVDIMAEEGTGFALFVATCIACVILLTAWFFLSVLGIVRAFGGEPPGYPGLKGFWKTPPGGIEWSTDSSSAKQVGRL